MKPSHPSPGASGRPAQPEAGAATGLIVTVGIAALAVAMGIGRFAFTPLLPLMLRDGDLDAATGAEWAAANYVGYLMGALTASRFSERPLRGLRLALWGVALSTLAVGGLGGHWLAWGGGALRVAAGVFSAWVLICASSWCLSALARRGESRQGAWIYTGVGLGIFGAGLVAWLGGGQAARALWLEFGLLALAGTLMVWRRLRGWASGVSAAKVSTPSLLPSQETGVAQRGLVLCYGAFGLGYIIPATFLPAMARQQVPDPLLFGLTWPVFGAAAALSVAVAARWLAGWPRRRVWALAQGAMAIGAALPAWTQALWALLASAVLVGGTFMVATMAGLQLARERSPTNPTRLVARMTVAFAGGQIAGPLLVRAIAASTWAGANALEWASAAASSVLALTALWLWRREAPPSASAPARP